MIGAKKLTWNTVFQSPVVSRQLSRPPPSPLGEIAALLTSACSRPPCAFSRSFITAMASSVLSGSARSTWMWSSGPASQGQASGKAMTRAGDHAPAGRGEALDRGVANAARCAGQDQGLAVLIGDRDMRGKVALGAARIEPGLGQGRVRRASPEHDPVMQPEGAGARTRSRAASADSRANNGGASPPCRQALRSGADSRFERGALDQWRDWCEAQAPIRLSRWRVAK